GVLPCNSLQQPTDFTKSYASFFSLLKRKKEAKKEKSSRYTCTTLQTHQTKITQEIFINKNPPAG
ncbi:MAG: hypothetical protein SOY50_09910, partial [Ruminococcus callidus]|nr:hypothetical protein [Ruminococcus callidus]